MASKTGSPESSLLGYVGRSVSKIVANPAKLALLFRARSWKYLYWSARFGTQSDLHDSRWTFSGDLAKRKYATYEEYKAHQISKIEKKSFRKRLDALEDDQYEGFRRRFALAPEIAGKRTVLCLGARLGTEVRAFKDLGFFAVGIDLNPGGNNRFVLSGDFHDLQFSDGTVDVVFTNVLDHAFNLQAVMNEIRRVLSPGGVALLEIIRGTDEGYLPQEYESIAWKTARGFAAELKSLTDLELVAFRPYSEIGDLYWSQAVFQKRT